MFSSPSSTDPLRAALGTSSCIRLRIRRKVDLPHPDGPISAVTCSAFIARETRSSTLCVPNQALTSRASRVAGSRPSPSRAGAGAGLAAQGDAATFNCRSPCLVAPADHAGEGEQDEDEGDEHERAGPRALQLALLEALELGVD